MTYLGLRPGEKLFEEKLMAEKELKKFHQQLLYCDPGKAAKELDWKAENGIKEMCEDSWRWQKNNPNG